MKLTGFFAELNFSRGSAEKAIDDAIEKALFKAWNAWVTEFIRIVPVWSGQSVGTILPLAEILGRVVPINAPQGTAPGNLSSLGAAKSSATLQGGRGKLTITYQTSLEHLIINEQFDARIWGFRLKKPGPYNFQKQCQEKFLETAKEARLPDMTQFIDYDKRSF
jgi:hypothetical protein